jgi:hypothetical protein
MYYFVVSCCNQFAHRTRPWIRNFVRIYVRWEHPNPYFRIGSCQKPHSIRWKTPRKFKSRNFNYIANEDILYLVSQQVTVFYILWVNGMPLGIIMLRWLHCSNLGWSKLTVCQITVNSDTVWVAVTVTLMFLSVMRLGKFIQGVELHMGQLLGAHRWTWLATMLGRFLFLLF